jgi:hypothetical protein
MAGADGINGTNGTNGKDGATGQTGAMGGSCTAIQFDGSATIKCSDGTLASVYSASIIDGFTTGDTLVWKNGQWEISPHYRVGDRGPAGGTVFYVTDKGLHGLEAAPSQQGTAPWGCDGIIMYSKSIDINERRFYCSADFTPNSATKSAAQVADEYQTSGYTDWYLPDVGEAIIMHRNNAVSVGSLMTRDVSYTQDNKNRAKVVSYVSFFGTKAINISNPGRILPSPVWPIRKF